MSPVEFLIVLVIAGICGSIAQTLAGYSHGGCLVSVALGLIGALIGTWMARQTGVPELFVIRVDNQTFPVLWSIIGAAVFVAVLALISGRRKTRD